MFKAILNFFNSAFKRLGKAFLKFSKRVAKIAVREGAPLILEITRQIVIGLINEKISGSEKKGIAFEKVEAYAKENGIRVSTNIINKVIEDVYLEASTTF